MSDRIENVEEENIDKRKTVQQVALALFSKQFQEYMEEGCKRLGKLVGHVAKSDFKGNEIISKLIKAEIIAEDTYNPDYISFNVFIKTKEQMLERLEELNISKKDLVLDIWQKNHMNDDDWDYIEEAERWPEKVNEIGNRLLDYMLAITYPTKYGKYSFEEVVSKAMNGNDDALCALVTLSNSLLRHDWVVRRIEKAEAEQDIVFKEKLAKAIAKPRDYKMGDIGLAWWLLVEARDKAETITDKELAKLAKEKFDNYVFDHDYIKTVRKRLGIRKK